MSPRSWNLLQIHGAVLLFGLAGVLGKLLPLAPVVIVFGRVLFASLALLMTAIVWRLPVWPRSWRSGVAFVGLGLLLALHWTTFFESVQASGVAIALLTFSTFPVFVALLEPLLFREKLRALDVLLVLPALAGILILMPGLTPGDLMKNGVWWDWTSLKRSAEMVVAPGDRAAQGVWWGIASGLTFAFLSLLNRKYVREHGSIALALAQDAVAGIALLPFVVVWRPAFTLKDVLLLVVLGVLCTALAHSLFIAGMRTIPARTASLIACLEPVYGSALALLIGEVPTARTVVGGALVLAVAFYATLRAGAERPAVEDAPTPRQPFAAEDAASPTSVRETGQGGGTPLR